MNIASVKILERAGFHAVGERTELRDGNTYVIREYMKGAGMYMRMFIKACQYGKYIGLLGLSGLILDVQFFQLFWLFWLLGLVEILCNLPVFIQNIKMVIGIFVVPIKYGNQLTNINNSANNVWFALPFSEKWVVVNGGVEKTTSHSWDIPTQRYAYDFVVLDNNGKSYCGDQTNVKSYYCYGKNILAPADGVVMKVLDGQPDSIISKKGTADCSARDIRGNYILIQHSENCFSVLAHLKRGTICVKVGENIYQGQILAQCGNSGNSSEPHLHFQVQNGQSFFFAAGVPIRFDAVSKEPFPVYAKYDSRPIKTRDENNYIMRGMVVRNMS